MKNKRITLLFVLLAVVVVGIAIYFITRQPHQQELIPPTFAKLPEKSSLIAEIQQGTSIYSVAFSPVNSSLIAFADENATITLWDRSKTDNPTTILVHPGFSASIGFSPTGKLLASGGAGKLVLWDVASGTKINSIESSTQSFAFSPDGHQLATVHNEVKVWDIRNPKKITEIATLPFNEEHKARGWACAVGISSDGKRIAAGYSNGTINVWDLQTKQLIKTLESSFYQMDFVKFSPNNKYMVTGGHDWDMYSTSSVKGYIMWELPSWKRMGEVQRGHVENLVFSPDGKICATANRRYFLGRGVELWSVDNGAPITSVSAEAIDVSFSQDGSLLATGGDDGILRLWQLKPQQLESATPPADVVRLIYFLPNGKKTPPNITEKLDKSIREVQDFYADEMERHGFGRKTFTFETDENGKAIIYLVKENQTTNINLSNEVWLTVVDDISVIWQAVPKLLHTGMNGTFWYISSNRNSVNNNVWTDEIKGTTHGRIVYAEVKDLKRKPLGYILKDAFGLPYIYALYEPNSLKRLFTRVNNKMPWRNKWAKLSRCQAEWLDKSRFFNPNQPFFDKSPKMEMRISVPKDSGLRHFIFEVADENGIHQVQIFVPIDIKNQRWRKKFHDCHTLKGKDKATIVFEVSDPEIYTVELRMIDMHGNIASREFIIQDKP